MINMDIQDGLPPSYASIPESYVGNTGVTVSSIKAMGVTKPSPGENQMEMTKPSLGVPTWVLTVSVENAHYSFTHHPGYLQSGDCSPTETAPAKASKTCLLYPAVYRKPASLFIHTR